jgi:hypothetical protein
MAKLGTDDGKVSDTETGNPKANTRQPTRQPDNQEKTTTTDSNRGQSSVSNRQPRQSTKNNKQLPPTETNQDKTFDGNSQKSPINSVCAKIFAKISFLFQFLRKKVLSLVTILKLSTT